MNQTKNEKTIRTSRFGEITVDGDHLIEFRDGMIGFPHLKEYVLVESNSVPLLLWLQSTENPAVAFPVMEPWFFKQDYDPKLADPERICLELAPGERTKMFVVLTIPGEMTRMTVNLKAPVVINLEKGKAVQMVLADRSFEVRVPAHEAFAKTIANFSLAQSADDITGDANDSWSPVSYRGTSAAERANSAGA